MKCAKKLIFISIFMFILPTYGDDHLTGVASYQELGREVFLGALYSSNLKSAEALSGLDSDLRIEVRATSNIAKRRWVNMWMQGIAINNKREVFEAEAENLVTLFDAFKGGLKNNDTFSLSYSPETGTSATLDGVELLAGQSQDFFRLFLHAWIGPVPPSSEFKESILGTASSADLAARLTSIVPLATRITEVSNWLVPPKEEKQEETVVKNTPAKKTPVSEPDLEAEEANSKLATVTEKETVVEAATVEDVVEEVVEELPEEEFIVSVESLIAQQEYTTEVIQKIYRSVKYPKSAIKRNLQGTVRIQLQIVRDGSIQTSQLSEESRHNTLNKAAMKAVNQAAPFPPIPESVAGESLEFTIPVTFRLSS